MVSEDQKERAKEIVERREKLETAGYILLDLLLDFWEAANEEFEENRSYITDIQCKEGIWSYSDKFQEGNCRDFPKGSEKIATIFEKIKKRPFKEIFSIRGYQSEIKGFSFEFAKDRFRMSIK